MFRALSVEVSWGSRIEGLGLSSQSLGTLGPRFMLRVWDD